MNQDVLHGVGKKMRIAYLQGKNTLSIGRICLQAT